jgi:hypothetical protein
MSLKGKHDLGYHGEGYCAKWDLEDLSYIIKLFSKIRRATKDKDFYNTKFLTEGFTDRLERAWNDHKQIVDENNNGFEPLEVTKATNRCVNDGLVRIAELVTGTTSALWTHLAVGSGSNQVSMSDSYLQTEIDRVALGTDGFQSAAGSVMRYGGFFSPSVASAQVSEAAVFDDVTSGVMFFRTVYPTPITHTVNSDLFTVAHSIYQVSV